MEYHSGNYEKYMSTNVLKKFMVGKFNQKITSIAREAVRNAGSESLILDAGCGEGFLSCLISNDVPYAKVIGIDASADAIRMAGALNKEICFQQGDIYKMPFADKMFDLVVCTEVLEHLDKPNQAVQELLRVAKNAVLISVPNEPWFCLGNLLTLKNIKRMGNPTDHVNHWTYYGFLKYMEKFGGGGLKGYRSFPWSIILLYK